MLCPRDAFSLVLVGSIGELYKLGAYEVLIYRYVCMYIN